MIVTMLYGYSEEDFVFVVDWSLKDTGTKFDRQLQYQWTKCVNEGHCRYHLGTLETKRLSGKFQFLAQLNTGRTFNRRTPESIESMDQLFDHSKFNFIKTKAEEHLFRLKMGNEDAKHFVLINVSPVEYCHSLLLPEFHQCLPQVATLGSIEVSVQILLLSSSPALRVAYNGLCAFASVNHLHYHIYYLQHRMLLEDIEAEHLSGPCYIIMKYPAPAFVFQLEDGDIVGLSSQQTAASRKATLSIDSPQCARSVYKLINYLQIQHIPHNVYMTRGTRFSSPSQGSLRNCVRVYVWARKPVAGIKNTAAFNPAALEVFGHIVVKTEDQYKQLTEEKASAAILDACQETFDSVKDQVKELFAE